MRIRNQTLNTIQLETGLSHPTIISLHKKFLAGGWQALHEGPRGRPARSATLSSADLQALVQQQAAVGCTKLWSIEALQEQLSGSYSAKSLRRQMSDIGLLPPSADLLLTTEQTRSLLQEHLSPAFKGQKKRLTCGYHCFEYGGQQYSVYCTQDGRRQLRWSLSEGKPELSSLIRFLGGIISAESNPLVLFIKFSRPENFPELQQWYENHRDKVCLIPFSLAAAAPAVVEDNHGKLGDSQQQRLKRNMPLTHLQRLEAESIQIMREVVSETENPVMLYSIGKDSAVMLHIAMKAFYPSLPPFPLLHVDTRWKFQEMYRFRDEIVKEYGLDLITHINPDGVAKDINPFTHGSAIHTDIMKTEGLKQALNEYGFDAAFGGARRDEEKSRAKERVFSFRSSDHRWDPKNQRPEIWKLYNARKQKRESIRVFPISNWTELDIWQYIYLENIPIVPLYYAAERPVVERDGTLIMVDDERMPLNKGEIPMMKKVRFRTLGCYPLTGAVESEADNLEAIIQEMLLTKTSERQGRVIDHDSAASMEKKKQEGYF